MIASNMISSQEFYIGYRLMRERFYFFWSFRETAKAIEDSEARLEYLEAVIRHGLGDEEIELSPLVNALMVQTRFTLDRSKEIADERSEAWKKWSEAKSKAKLWNQNAVKNWEKVSKQNKTQQIITKQNEEEVEVEEEYKEKEDNKLSSKKKKDLLSPLDLVWAYESNDTLSSKIRNTDAVKHRAEYKQRKRERAYKTVDWFIQQLAVMVKTVENWVPRTDVWSRLEFAVNQAEENERKGIVWNDKVEQDYLSFKKFSTLWTKTH